MSESLNQQRNRHANATGAARYSGNSIFISWPNFWPVMDKTSQQPDEEKQLRMSNLFRRENQLAFSFHTARRRVENRWILIGHHHKTHSSATAFHVACGMWHEPDVENATNCISSPAPLEYPFVLPARNCVRFRLTVKYCQWNSTHPSMQQPGFVYHRRSICGRGPVRHSFGTPIVHILKLFTLNCKRNECRWQVQPVPSLMRYFGNVSRKKEACRAGENNHSTCLYIMLQFATFRARTRSYVPSLWWPLLDLLPSKWFMNMAGLTFSFHFIRTRWAMLRG